MIKNNDHVQIKKTLPEWGIQMGEIGFVVGSCIGGYFVEFPDSGLVLPLTENEIEVIHGN